MKKLYKELKKKGVINDKVTLGDVWNKQHGGNHYQKYVIQPSKFVVENKLLYPEGCAIKYIIRHQDKGKKQDLLKAIHFIEMIIKRDYK
jgi:hypothetical protein